MPTSRAQHESAKAPSRAREAPNVSRTSQTPAALRAQRGPGASSTVRRPVSSTRGSAAATSARRHPLVGALVVALIFAALFGMQAAYRATQGGGAAGEEPRPFYDWDGFSQVEGRYRYAAGEVLADKTGIDVSDHQGWIDWQAVAADGIDFAYIRAGYRGSTEGGLYEDECFAFNLASAREAGLECGVYFFSQARTEEEAREEARFALQLLGETSLEYPIAFDSERTAQGIASRTAELDEETMTAIAKAFIAEIEAAGHACIVYGNGHDLGRIDFDALPDVPIWYAEYGALPSYTGEFVLWQYARTGQVEGIETDVDMDLDLSGALAAAREA